MAGVVGPMCYLLHDKVASDSRSLIRVDHCPYKLQCSVRKNCKPNTMNMFRLNMQNISQIHVNAHSYNRPLSYNAINSSLNLCGSVEHMCVIAMNLSRSAKVHQLCATWLGHKLYYLLWISSRYTPSVHCLYRFLGY